MNQNIRHLHVPRILGCEFCDEFTNPKSSRFEQIYGSVVKSRIVANQGAFVAMPTIGQLFRGSLLILPVDHFETMAEVPDLMLSSLATLLMRIESWILPLGRPILFEHGARCSTGGGCGIYHAHMHLVPVPGQVHYMDILPDGACQVSNLGEAFRQLTNSNEYLLFRDTAGQVVFLEPSETQLQRFASQYFRRMLVQHFRLEASWDWRAYNRKEPWLLDTLNWYKPFRSRTEGLGGNHVPIS